MSWSRDTWRGLALLSGALVLTSCGGSDGGSGTEVEGNNGTVTDQWAGFCTGVFTEDTPFLDSFDKLAFTAKQGDEYLLAEFTDSFDGRAEVLYLAEAGPRSFQVEPNEDGDWPFTSNCAIGEGVPYYGVFTDVSVFADEDLTTKICDLSAGSVLSAEGTGRGFGFTRSDGEAAIYEVILGPFSEECDQQGTGYVRVPRVELFGSATWLVPLAGLIGPE